MSTHFALPALLIAATMTGPAWAQSNSNVLGWWYAADNQWQLRVAELRPDGTATLGTCIRAHPYDQVCAGAAKVKFHSTYELRGNEMWTTYDDGLKTITTFVVTRPDPRSSLRKMKINDGPNNVFFVFEMPSPPPGGWISD
jgi:hypothetical protein